MGPFADAAGVALRSETAFDGLQGLVDEQVLDHAVSKREGEDAAALRVFDPEGASWAGMVAMVGEVDGEIGAMAMDVDEKPGDVCSAAFASGGALREVSEAFGRYHSVEHYALRDGEGRVSGVKRSSSATWNASHDAVYPSACYGPRVQHESTLPPDIYHATAEVVAAMFSHDPQTFVRLDARALAVANADLSWLLAPGIDPRLARAPRFALGSTGSSP